MENARGKIHKSLSHITACGMALLKMSSQKKRKRKWRMSGQDFVAIVVLRTILHGLSPL